LVNQRAASNFNLQNLKQEQTPPGDQMRFRKNGADQQQQRFGPNNAFGPSSSRSMSNINQAQASQNAPPIPNKPLQYGQRRGWDFPKGGVQQQSAAAAILPPQLPSPDYDPSYVPNSYAPHQQRNNQYPSPQQNPSSWYPSGGGMGSSISLGSLKAAQQQQQNTTPSSHDHRVQQLTKVPTNYKQMAVPYHQQQPTVMAASFHAAVSSPFEDVNRDDGLSHTPNSRQWERESFSKRYLNQQVLSYLVCSFLQEIF
jgi:hypothetical protein